jgi:hypothetical protein
MEPWRVYSYRPVIKDYQHLNEKQDPDSDPHLIEKLDPEPH